MKAQINGPDEVFNYNVVFDNNEERNKIWIGENELIELTEEEVELIKQYRVIAAKYYNLCKAKKKEQDERG